MKRRFIVYNTINSRSEVLHYTQYIIICVAISWCVCGGNSSTEAGRPRLISLPSLSALTRQREREREISIEEIIINRRGGHFTRIYIYIYVYGDVARGRQDNYRFEIVYVGTLIEPRRLNNSHRRDSSSGFFSIVETARRAMERERKNYCSLSPQWRRYKDDVWCIQR